MSLNILTLILGVILYLIMVKITFGGNVMVLTEEQRIKMINCIYQGVSQYGS